MDKLKSYSEIEVKLSELELEAKWSEKKYFLDEIVNDLELPQIAKVCSPSTGSDLEKRVDITRSFLLYSRRRRTKVVAQVLYYDSAQKAWIPDGPNLEIPKDYTGWFEKVQGDRGEIHNAYSACDSIDKIVKSTCRKFLVRTPIIGHRYMEDENGIVLLDEVNIYVGEILRCNGVVKRQWKVKNNSTDVVTAPETSFLKCTDPRKNRLCISLGHPGKFSPIYDKKKSEDNPKNSVYLISDIIENEMQFPTTVRLAFGWMPKLPLIPRTFQGVIQLVGMIRPDTLVMCSLVDNAMPLLEVPINMNVKVTIDESKDKWLNHPASEKTLKKCYNSVYSFLTSIKIMDIKYKGRAITIPSSGESNGSSIQKAPEVGRIASPIDMNEFNPLDVFPPMTKPEDISDTWTLSFRDPEHVLDEQGDAVGGSNKLYLGKSEGSLRETRKEEKRSAQNDTRGYKKNDLRAIRDRELRAREAHC